MASTTRFWLGTFFIIISACGSIDPTEKLVTESKAPATVSLSNARALFLAKGTLSSSSAFTAKSTALQTNAVAKKTLKSVNSSKEIKDADFKDEDGNVLDVQVTNLRALNEAYSGLELEYGGGTVKRALLRHSDGKLFDVTDYSLSYAQIRGNDLFLPKSATNTLYRVDLASLQAQAVNNPGFDPINIYPNYLITTDNGRKEAFLLDAATNVLAYLSYNSAQRIFFADNSPPVTANASCVRSSTFVSYVYGDNGKSYVYSVETRNTGVWNHFHYLTEVSFSSSGMVCNETQVRSNPLCDGTNPSCTEDNNIAAVTNYGINDRSRFTLFQSGYMAMTPHASGAVTLTWTSKNLTSVTPGPTLSGGYIYWKSGNSIYRMEISAAGTSELVTTMTNIISFKVAGGAVIFTRYITGTSIGTYQVNAPGATPELLASSDMEVESIVELQI